MALTLPEGLQSRCIAVDGTAGSGKSTLARKLARKLGGIHLSTGLLYRHLAFAKSQQWEDLKHTDYSLCEVGKGSYFFHYLSERLPKEIEREEWGQAACKIASDYEVRHLAFQILRYCLTTLDNHSVEFPLLVLDGRDIGSVMAPECPLKFYVDAELSVRAFRLSRSFASKGSEVGVEECAARISARDKQDMERSLAPLVTLDSAHVIDNSKDSRVSLKKMLAIAATALR